MGEPPHRVSAEAVRRRVIRRRVVEFTAAAVAVAVIAVIIPVGIGALGRAHGPSNSSPAVGRIVTSRHYGYTEALPAGWRLVTQATRQWDGTGAPGYDSESLTSSKGRAASRPGRTQHQRRRTWWPTRQRPSGPPAPHIHARPRKPTRPSRSAGHPPGCWACNARQGAASWWRSRSPSTMAPRSCSHPSTARGRQPTSPPTAPPSANSWPASGFNGKGSPTRDHATRAPLVTPEAVTAAPISCRYQAGNPAKAWPSHRGDHDVPETANSR